MQQFIREQFSSLAEGDRRKVIYENTAKLYGFGVHG
jgi:hypothetical protein